MNTSRDPSCVVDVPPAASNRRWCVRRATAGVLALRAGVLLVALLTTFARARADDALAIVPTLEAIGFEGRVYFKDETLRARVRHVVPAPLDRAVIDDDARTIERDYHERGFLHAAVHAVVVAGSTPMHVRAIFVIEAGERAELKSVHVSGNVLVDESVLRDGFFTRPPEPLGFLTRAGLFHRPYLDQDGQRLVFNYYRRGHLEARVLQTRVQATSDLTGITVDMGVFEGPVYELADVRVEGELPLGLTIEGVRASLLVHPGDVADLVGLQQAAEASLVSWREQGHPFARVEQSIDNAPPPSGRMERRGVVVTLRFVAGPAARVARIVVSGNKGTQDHVIRRDIALHEGDAYDDKALRRTERLLMATGLFQQVTARAVPGQAPVQADGTALVDVEVSVVETVTWLLSPAFLGDPNEGLIFIGVAGDRNLLGTGLSTLLSAQLSGLRQLFDVSVSEPRLFDSRDSVSTEVHRRELRYRDFKIASTLGGSVRLTVPFELGFSLGGPARAFVGGGLGVEHGGVIPYDDRPLLASSLLPQAVFRNTLEARAGIDTREGGLSPRNGMYVGVDATGAGPWSASGTSFVDAEGSLKLYWTPAWDITLKSNTQVGVVLDPAGDTPPVTDRFFLGGFGSVRGYFPRSIGPRADVPLVDGTTTNAEIGGVVKFVQNTEVELSLWPGTPFRGFAFFDVGDAFGEGELDALWADGSLTRDGARIPAGLFTSVGGGVLIETPVLPFRLEWSVPLQRRAIDQPVNFFLGVGSAF